jgi:hypothetical protein
VTRATPPAARYVVTGTFERGSYARSASNGSSGASSKKPPRRQSRMRAKTDGESTAGEHSQSTEPSEATRAAVRPSPITAYSRIGA